MMKLQFPSGLVGNGLDLPFFQEGGGFSEQHLLGLVGVFMEIEDAAFALGWIMKKGDILSWLLVSLLECLKILGQLLNKVQAELADLYAIGHGFFGWKMLLEGIWNIQIVLENQLLGEIVHGSTLYLLLLSLVISRRRYGCILSKLTSICNYSN